MGQPDGKKPKTKSLINSILVGEFTMFYPNKGTSITLNNTIDNHCSTNNQIHITKMKLMVQKI